MVPDLPTSPPPDKKTEEGGSGLVPAPLQLGPGAGRRGYKRKRQGQGRAQPLPRTSGTIGHSQNGRGGWAQEEIKQVGRAWGVICPPSLGQRQKAAQAHAMNGHGPEASGSPARAPPWRVSGGRRPLAQGGGRDKELEGWQAALGWGGGGAGSRPAFLFSAIPRSWGRGLLGFNNSSGRGKPRPCTEQMNRQTDGQMPPFQTVFVCWLEGKGRRPRPHGSGCMATVCAPPRAAGIGTMLATPRWGTSFRRFPEGHWGRVPTQSLPACPHQLTHHHAGRVTSMPTPQHLLPHGQPTH